MDREEYHQKLDQLTEAVSSKKYDEALQICDEIDWRRVKSLNTLNMVADVYEVNKEYRREKDILLIAYSRASIGRSILYRLVEVCIKLNQIGEAEKYYKAFCKTAKNDSSRCILQYRLYKATNAPLEAQIDVLEEYREKEYTERWAYELATLYAKAGNRKKCVDACDDLILWFGEGKYVLKAMELKQRYEPLTPSQQKTYEKMVAAGGYKEREETRTEADAADRANVRLSREAVYSDGSGLRSHTSSEAEEVPSETSAGENAPDTRSAGDTGASDQEAERAETSAHKAENAETSAVPSDENAENSEESEEEIYDQDEEPEEYADDEADSRRSSGFGHGGFRQRFAKTFSDIFGTGNQDEDDDSYFGSEDAEYTDVSEVSADAEDTEEDEDTEEETKRLPDDAGSLKLRSLKEENLQVDVTDNQPKAQAVADEEEEEPVEEQPEELSGERQSEEEQPEAEQPEKEEEPESSKDEDSLKVNEDGTLDLGAFLASTMGTLSSAASGKEESASDADGSVEVTADDVTTEAEPAADETIVETAEAEPSAEAVETEPAETESSAEAVEAEPVEAETSAEAVEAEPAEAETSAEALEAEPAETEPSGETAEAEQDTITKGQESAEQSADEENLENKEEKTETQDTEQSGAAAVETGEPVVAESAAAAIAGLAAGVDAGKEQAETENPESVAVGDENDDDMKVVPDKKEKKPHYIEGLEVPDPEPSPEEKKKHTHTISLDTIGENTVPISLDKILSEETPEERRIRILNKAKPTRMSEEQRKIFTYFARVPGMDGQILEAMNSVYQHAGEKTSLHGNIAIMGAKGTGKSRLAHGLIIAMCRDLGLDACKVARISGKKLNEKDAAKVVSVMSGGFLVIEDISNVNSETLNTLNRAMEFRTDCMIVIIEDEKTRMRAFLKEHPSFASKFEKVISIPVFTNDELVTFARTYATENGCKIDDMAILALYTMIGNVQSEEEPATISTVKEIIDKAILHATKGRRKRGNIDAEKTGKWIIIHEKDLTR